MAEHVRAHDWAATALGAMETWPDRIIAVVELVLDSPLIASVALTDQRLLIYNDAAAALYGARHPDVLGRPLAEAFPDSYPHVAALYDRIFAGETVTVAAQPLAVGDQGNGHEVFDAYLTPVRDAAGDVVGAHMVGIEISRRERDAKALRDSETRFRAFVTASADAVYRMSPDWRQMRQLEGRNFLRDTGTPTEHWLDDYIHTADQGAVWAAIDQAIETRSDFDLEHRVIRRDGSLGVTRSRAVPILDDAGEISEWLGTAIDVTAAKAVEVARAKAEAASRRAETRYLALFNAIDQGFCTIEVGFDADGRPCDYRFVEVNAAFERQTGLADPTGLWIRSIVPDQDQHWFDIYGRVARTGEPARFEDYSTPLDRWFEVFAFRIDAPEANRVGVLFRDINDRKRVEQALRENGERQRFLLHFGDAIRGERDAAGVIAVATRLLGEKLGASRVVLAEIDEPAGVAHIRQAWVADGAEHHPPMLRLADFGGPLLDDLRAGRVARYDDVGTPPYARPDLAALAAIGIRAGLSVPLIIGGCFVLNINVHQHTPRRWTDSDVALVVEVAERLWAAVERARAEAALRDTEERLQKFGEASQDVLWIRDAETLQSVYLTPAFETIYGIDRETFLGGDNMAGWRDLVLLEDRAEADRNIARVRGGQWVTFEFRIRRPSDGAIRWLRNTAFPIKDAEGRVVRLGGIGQDITDRKLSEQALAAIDKRQRALLNGIPQLVWRAAADGAWTWASPQWTDFTGQSEAESLGDGWLDTVHPDDCDTVRAIWRGAVAGGEFEAEFRICQPAAHRYRWFQARATPVRDDDGTIIEWLGTSTDIDDLRRLQEHQHVLVAELQHRVRNILAIIRSIMRRSLHSDQSQHDYAQHLEGRVAALARTQVLLTRQLNAYVDLEELVRDELIAQAADTARTTVDGPQVDLSPKAAEVLALAIHELSTNSVKYGAIAHPGATLSIRWRTEDRDGDRWLVLTWDELGVTVPAGTVERVGFGTELITRRVPYELKGHGELDIRSGGVACTISFPLLDRPSILESGSAIGQGGQP